MTQVNPPPQIKLPKEFEKSPAIRSYFQNLDRMLLQLWTRTGGGEDFIEDDKENIASVSGMISRLSSLITAAEQKLNDIEQLTASLNNGFSKLEKLKNSIENIEQSNNKQLLNRFEDINKKVGDLEQSSSNVDNVAGKVNSKVSGPTTATDNAIARFNNSGNVVENSSVTIDDSGKITVPTGAWDNTGIDINSGDTYQINSVTILSATALGSSVLASSLTSVGTLTSLSVSGTITGPSGSWSSTGMNLGSGDTYKINGTTVLSSSTLGSGITSSSLTSLGTITSFVAGAVNTTGAYSVDGIQVLSNQGAAVADASGGATVDAEARTAINSLLARVRTHGFIAT